MQRKLFTTTEYHKLDEIGALDIETKYELINGNIIHKNRVDNNNFMIKNRFSNEQYQKIVACGMLGNSGNHKLIDGEIWLLTNSTD